MSYVIAEPQIMATVAADLEGIGSAIGSASAAAAGPTSGVAAAAADEVSSAIAKLFGAFGEQYQAVMTQVAALHDELTRTLAAAGFGYAETEAANASAVSASIPMTPLTAPTVALVMGGSGSPIPKPDYFEAILNYVTPQFGPVNAQTLFTPEQLYPITGVKSLPLTASVSQGVQMLHTAIMDEITHGNSVVAVGYSQSAIIDSLEMRQLAALGPAAPTADQLGFVLLADPMNPNGGLLSRFAGLNAPSLGVDFFGATPADTIYPTAIYTHEYDGFADFPRYPLNLISDLNAVAGIAFVHTDTPFINPQTLPAGDLIKLGTDATYTGNTSYYMVQTHNLPLLDPLRFIPVVGDPLADLIQPDLTTIVNLGYGDPNYGYSTAPANLATPFGLFPQVDPGAVAGNLVIGAQQGFSAAASDLITGGPPSAPSLSLPNISTALTSIPSAPAALQPPTSIDSFISDLQAANTNITSTFTEVSARTYATLLPTADIVNAAITTLPSYDVNLFLDGIQQAIDGDPVGLINAIGYPIAADTGLLAVGGGLEGLVLAGIVVTEF